MTAYDLAGLIGYCLALLFAFPAFCRAIWWVCGPRWKPAQPALPCQAETLNYRGSESTLYVPRDGACLGYTHPLSCPVRITRGIPTAVGPHGTVSRWSAAQVAWVAADPELAAEAGSRAQLEDTRADDSLPVVEPVACWADSPKGGVVIKSGSSVTHRFCTADGEVHEQPAEPLGPYTVRTPSNWAEVLPTANATTGSCP